MIRSRHVAYLLVLLVVGFSAYAEDAAPPALADGQCSVPADERWTPQEKFVWSRTCAGQTADFSVAPGYGGDLDPRNAAGLPENRILRPEFIETILLKDRYRQALTRGGVRIAGARFIEVVDLRNAELAHDLWLDHSLLEKGADFSGLRSTRRVTLDGSKVMGPFQMEGFRVNGGLAIRDSELSDVALSNAQIGDVLDLESSKFSGALTLAFAQIGGTLLLTGSKVTGQLDLPGIRIEGHLGLNEAEFTEVVVAGAHVGGQMTLARSKVRGTLNMAGLQLDGNLAMDDKAEFAKVIFVNAHLYGHLALDGARAGGTLDMTNLQLDGGLDMSNKAEFSEVILVNARVGAFLSLKSSKVTGRLNMARLQLNGFLDMSEKADFADVDLVGAHVGGFLSLKDSKIAGSLNCEFLEVGGPVFLGYGADFAGPINLIFGKVGELVLAAGTFHSDVDITGAQIGSDLVLGSSIVDAADWPGDPVLILHNAKADAIQDLPNAWPPRLDLNGFTYRSLGGVYAGKADRMADRPVEWFESWLAKEPYSPQPYEQLAAVLQAQGRPDAADDILYSGKQQERARAGFSRRVWLIALDWFIGYGYRIDRALIWVAGFLFGGVAVLRLSGEGRRNGMPYGIAYSFDALLPIISLREKHREIDLSGWARYYFYIHKIMGYVLASFLIAGLSGLVK